MPNVVETMRALVAPRCMPLLVATVLAACSHDATTGTKPPPPSRRVAIGDTVTATASPGAVDVHSFQAQSGDRIAIEVNLPSGQATVSVIDSATSTVIATGNFMSGADFTHNSLPAIDAAHAVYLVTVAPYSGSTVSLRYIVAPVNTTPEIAPALLTYGQAVTEPLGGGSDIDDFKFDGAKDDEALIFVQGQGAPGTGGLISVRLIDDTTGTVVSQFYANGIDPDSQSSGSGRVRLPRTGRFRIDVFAVVMAGQTGPWQYAGPYRLELLKENRAPEHTPAAVVSGDTITGESIDYAYDIDEYRIAANAGDEFNVFLQAVPGPAANAFKVQMTGIADSATRMAVSKGTDTLTLLQNSTGRFRAIATGTILVRVSGWEDGNAIYRGPYRLLVEKVSRAPEHIAATPRQLGDTIAGERIDFPGDVDEIPFTLAAPTMVHVEDRRLAAGTPGSKLTMKVVRASDDSLFAQGDVDYAMGQALPVASGTLTTRLGAGDYLLRASSEDAQFGYYGGWSAVLQRVDTLPEGRSSTIASGDTVVETIDPVGDIDTYHMAVRRGRHYQLTLQSTYNGGTGSSASIRTDPSLPWDDFQVTGMPSTGLSDAAKSERMDAAKSATYTVHVAETSQGRNPSERGPYRFVLGPFDGRPEHHAASVAAGDSVTDEAMDYLGDLDQFSLSGAAGTEFAVRLRGNGLLIVQVVDTAADSILTQMQSAGYMQCTPRFRLPASGTVLVDAFANYAAFYGSPYYLLIAPVNRAPEVASGAYSVGDTVSTESLGGCEDVDEFTFSGIAGERVRALFDLPTGGPPNGIDSVRVEIARAGSDSALGAASGNSTTFSFDYATGVVTLPATGSYVVRVRFGGGLAGEPPVPYRFYVRDEP